jgi:hypothetical protein
MLVAVTGNLRIPASRLLRIAVAEVSDESERAAVKRVEIMVPGKRVCPGQDAKFRIRI